MTDAVRTLLILTGGVLVLGTIAGEVLARFTRSPGTRRIGENVRQRTRSWWIMSAVFCVSILLGPLVTVMLFALTSFFALREYVTLTPAARGDHRALFLAFFVFLPLQYIVVAQERDGLIQILIPVYAFIMLAARIAAAGQSEAFLARTARLHWGLMTCVYFVSHVPALLALDLPGAAAPSASGDAPAVAGNAALVFFLILIVQLSDVFQYVFGVSLGKRKIAPTVSPNKTVEGLAGGLVSATVGAAMLAWATPFTPVQAAFVGLAVALAGFFGDITMSAIKRDIGVKDFSTMIPGHGGVLDRLDSLAFAAPIFYHLTRWLTGA